MSNKWSQWLCLQLLNEQNCHQPPVDIVPIKYRGSTNLYGHLDQYQQADNIFSCSSSVSFYLKIVKTQKNPSKLNSSSPESVSTDYSTICTFSVCTPGWGQQWSGGGSVQLPKLPRMWAEIETRKPETPLHSYTRWNAAGLLNRRTKWILAGYLKFACASGYWWNTFSLWTKIGKKR